jgi:hypothetical protein
MTQPSPVAAVIDGSNDPPDDRTGPAPHNLEPAMLVALSLVWLAAMMWTAHASIAGNGTAAVVVSTAALALPAVIAASLVAGSATGLATVARWVGRRRPPVRMAVGAAGGAACGLGAAALILAGYGGSWSVGLLAITVGAAGAIGGALAAIRPAAIVAAGTAAALAQFVVGALLGYVQSRLKPILGGGDTAASRLVAANWYALIAALVGGVVAGLVAFAYLRRRGSTLRWPAYLLAGAWAGLFGLLAELLTRVGGGPLLNAVSRLDADNRLVNDYLDASRVKSLLVVGFTGAIVAMIAFGRTLRPGSLDVTAPEIAASDAFALGADVDGEAVADGAGEGNPDRDSGTADQAGPSS